MKNRAFVVLFAAGAALCLVACGNGATSSTPALTEPPADTAVVGSGSAVPGQAAAAPAPPVKGQPGGSGTEAAVPAPGPLPPVPVGGTGKLVRTVAMTVQVANGKFDEALTAVFALAAREGGVVSGSDASNGAEGRIRTGSVRLSIPSEKLDAAVGELRDMGTVERFHVDAQDVGAQYVDVQARLKNAESQRDAFLALLQQAKSISEIVAVQSQIGNVQAQIEQLKGQLSYLDHSTSFSTVSVTFREAGVVPAAPPADDWGTRTALEQGVHWFVASFNLLVVVLIAAGPWLLVTGAVALLLRRRRGARAARA